MPTKNQFLYGERRLAKIEVADEVLLAMMFQSFESRIKTIGGLPEGAIFVTAVNDPVLGLTWFFFYHPSFGEIRPGMEIPTLEWSLEHGS